MWMLAMDRPDRHHSCGLLLGYFFLMLGGIIADILVIEELGKW
jgi:hypothetical protein